MHDPSDTQMNSLYDDLVCLRELTPPAQGILPSAGEAREVVEQPTTSEAAATHGITITAIEKATGQEIHDPSVTQMNAMYDVMCLGEVTPPAQGILAIPQVILNVRMLIRRFPAAAVRSPFLHDDIRGGDTFDHYMNLGDGGMHVGQTCGVDKLLFEEIMLPDKYMHIEHIESYMAILLSRPDLAGLKEVHSNIALMSSYFMETVEEVFDAMHKGMREEFQQYDHTLFDPTIEEVIPVEEMDRLCLFAKAVQPNWGDNMKEYIQCDKVVNVCNYNDHWGSILLDLKNKKNGFTTLWHGNSKTITKLIEGMYSCL
ncbi:hypothetical protein OROMI_021064 [Orobanche minor]